MKSTNLSKTNSEKEQKREAYVKAHYPEASAIVNGIDKTYFVTQIKGTHFISTIQLDDNDIVSHTASEISAETASIIKAEYRMESEYIKELAK